jgi:hypothetical protein
MLNKCVGREFMRRMIRVVSVSGVLSSRRSPGWENKSPLPLGRIVATSVKSWFVKASALRKPARREVGALRKPIWVSWGGGWKRKAFGMVCMRRRSWIIRWSWSVGRILRIEDGLRQRRMARQIVSSALWLVERHSTAFQISLILEAGGVELVTGGWVVLFTGGLRRKGPRTTLASLSYLV